MPWWDLGGRKGRKGKRDEITRMASQGVLERACSKSRWRELSWLKTDEEAGVAEMMTYRVSTKEEIWKQLYKYILTIKTTNDNFCFVFSKK